MILLKAIGFILYSIITFIGFILFACLCIYGAAVVMTLGAIIPYHLSLFAAHYLSPASLEIFNWIVGILWFICLSIVFTLTMKE